MTGVHPSVVLGLDAGGTKTVAILADAAGRALTEARGAGANLQAMGELEVEKTLHDVMDRALASFSAAPVVVCLGMAGADRAGDAAILQSMMRRIAYKARVLVTNDALVALVAGIGHEPGVVIVAGTGSIAYGRTRDDRAARAGGWGHVLGDEGSGYWIGRRALRAVVRQADGRGPATGLTPRILQLFCVDRPEGLIREIYQRPLQPMAIAGVARCVEEAAADGDPISSEILETAARELIVSAASVTVQLGLAGEAFTFVLAGGMFEALPSLARALAGRLPAIAPHARVKKLDREPAWGAVQLALAEAESAARIPTYDRA
jgi:N-acetylglucosamine kinase-like BadF-type ATPase